MANQKSTKTNKSASTNTKKTVTKTTPKTTAKKTTTKNTTKATPKKVETIKTTQTKKVEVKPVEKKVEVKDAVKKVEPKKESKNNNVIMWTQDNLKLIGGFIIVALLIINIILIVNGHKVKLSNGKEIIASIKGKEVTAEELFDNLRELNGTNALINMIDNHITDKELSKDDLENAKNRAQEQVDAIRSQYEAAGQNFEQVLTSYGYENESVLLEEFITSFKKEIVVTNYLKKELTDKEIEEYYDESVFDSYTVKHILIKPQTNDDMSDEEKETAENAAKEKAEEVINKLNDGENWSDLVNTYSEDEGSKEDEGLIENFTKGDVVDEFFNASKDLEDDEYSKEPVKSEFGYHVIYKVSSTAKKSLKDSKEDIIDELVENKLLENSSLYNETWIKIRNNYKLTINDTTIKNSYEKTING